MSSLGVFNFGKEKFPLSIRLSLQCESDGFIPFMVKYCFEMDAGTQDCHVHIDDAITVRMNR